jgi:branched-chain amino acid aminotransferase
VGTMNIFLIIDDILMTPPLEGSILPGITRDSVLRLARTWGLEAQERRISINEVIEASKQDRLQEIFGTGTAAVISPVSEIQYKDTRININDGRIGPVAEKLFNEISDIQYGEIADTFGWIYNIQ